ncbi:MAG: AI-2E family transporter [Lentisphaerae bacterium]|nr:AI-2E family transporter [Lentisphaerota bacterium]
MPTCVNPEPRPRPVYVYLIVVAAAFAFIQSFLLLAPILLSFLLILLISLAINPVISRMRARTGGRKRATGLIVAGVVVVMGLTGFASLGPMKGSFFQLSQKLPGYWARLQKPLIQMEQRAQLSEERLQAEVTTEIEGTGGDSEYRVTPRVSKPVAPAASDGGSLRTSLGQMIQRVAGSFGAVAFNTAQIVIVLVTVFFGVTFTLMDPRPIFGIVFSLVPERHHAQALVILQRIGVFVPRWALSTLLGMMIIGVLVFLLMWPIFGFTDALVLGLIACVLESIPYLGPILSAVPALLLSVGKGSMTPLWVILAYLVIQALENNVILPIIMARGMQLHPVAVIFSMLLCVAAFGVLGVLLAAPLVGILGILHDELYRKRFLPGLTDADLDRLARCALRETQADVR